ncbi:uncharacterized protein CIMG_12835 [Coccidioides immitis RS]|uniref:Uncharacterized protein n=1 Tax=Coccidioides immitis (strain RS) TaxID=246410 RepID=A0A0D8JTI0_COCIM|nr:uncharacterized protein CIMG_12835 [Coccidioides immitis RS]KJF60266.1 hypothetical protein CIMG_12835 [Coccidioides immitis RS]
MGRVNSSISRIDVPFQQRGRYQITSDRSEPDPFPRAHTGILCCNLYMIIQFTQEALQKPPSIFDYMNISSSSSASKKTNTNPAVWIPNLIAQHTNGPLCRFENNTKLRTTWPMPSEELSTEPSGSSMLRPNCHTQYEPRIVAG